MDNKKRLNEVSSTSLDVREDLVKRLLSVVPEAETDGKIDWDKLKQELTGVIDESPERYNFTWNGKKQAMKLAQLPSTATLKPNKEKSKNWDTTENLYIEGDNLEVLKLLQKSYANKIKLIYIDPPYNTGKDFVYKDNYRDTLQNYLEQTGQVDGDGNKLSVNTDTSGRYHTDWLNMMYPRLKLARNLLTDDGVIFISIDENEIANLEKVVSEIFGENNLAGTIVWDKRNPKGDTKGVAMQHEYVLVVTKNLDSFSLTTEFKRKKKNADLMLKKATQIFKKLSSTFTVEDANLEYKNWLKSMDSLSGGERAYSMIDKQGNIYRSVSMSAPDKPETRSHMPLIHPVTKLPTSVPAKGWRYTDKSMDDLIDKDLVIFGKNEKTIPNRKYFLHENLYEGVPSLYYNGSSGSSDLVNLGLKQSYFDNPKPVDLLVQIIQSTTTNNDLVLDFFSGSSTTAEAVMRLNSEDGGNRKFIMVQLPEQLSEKDVAYADGYKTIPEIAQERIRRAGDKIVDENPLFASKLDIGFKVFELDKSNIKKWNIDSTNLVDQIEMLQDNFETGSTPLDVVYEIMLKQGHSLTSHIVEENLDDSVVFTVEYGAMFIVLGDKINSSVANYIVDKIKELEIENSIVVFQDQQFESDSEKLNAIEILNENGVAYDNILSI